MSWECVLPPNARMEPMRALEWPDHATVDRSTLCAIAPADRGRCRGLNATDMNARIADEGRAPLVPLVHPHEVSQGGRVFQDEHVKVTAALVPHPPMVPALAFRFDTGDRSIMISGDTARSDRMVELAQGADVLVHSAVYLPAVDRLNARVPNATALKQSIIAGQTSVEDAGRVAQASGVKTLVLSHLIPADDSTVTDQMWIEAARTHFRGSVIVGKDLLEI
jgi:ribonuclease BN (tRNA processing enzyme)